MLIEVPQNVFLPESQSLFYLSCCKIYPGINEYFKTFFWKPFLIFFWLINLFHRVFFRFVVLADCEVQVLFQRKLIFFIINAAAS